MALTIFTNISQLVNVRTESKILRGAQLAELPTIGNAYLLVKDGLIEAFGKMEEIERFAGAQEIDVSGKMILPCWADSHTHLVFAASREDEFVDKLKGRSYAEIAAKGGGILNSAKKVAVASEHELLTAARVRLNEVIRLGTGSIEIKSGYGLSVESELKMLRVIQSLKESSPIPIKSTFLGAHAFPEKFATDHAGYVNLITNEMLPEIAKHKLADFVDVFCERGFFTNEETEKVCRAALKYGLRPKIHANQLSSTGAVQTGVNLNAITVDHLETMDEDSIFSLASSLTIGTLLPTAAYFLRMEPPPARKLLNANAAIAVASDYNPGSSPSGNMNLVVAMSCISMRMLPEEAINAATINGAYAMELGEQVGSITKGKRANLIITRTIPSIAYIPYAFGSNCVESVWIGESFFKSPD